MATHYYLPEFSSDEESPNDDSFESIDPNLKNKSDGDSSTDVLTFSRIAKFDQGGKEDTVIDRWPIEIEDTTNQAVDSEVAVLVGGNGEKEENEEIDFSDECSTQASDSEEEERERTAIELEEDRIEEKATARGILTWLPFIVLAIIISCAILWLININYGTPSLPQQIEALKLELAAKTEENAKLENRVVILAIYIVFMHVLWIANYV